MKRIPTSILALFLLLAACTPMTNEASPTGLPVQDKLVTLWIGPEQVDCFGAYPQLCLLVKEEANAESYDFFYDPIEGFSFEPGYTYQLQVVVSAVRNPPADGSSLAYELVEIVSKTSVEPEVDENSAAAEEPLPQAFLDAAIQNTSWTLQALIVGGDAEAPPPPGSQPVVQFDDFDMTGNAGCNALSATVSAGYNAFNVTKLATEDESCGSEIDAYEQAFIEVLENARFFYVSGEMLVLENSAEIPTAYFYIDQPHTDATGPATGMPDLIQHPGWQVEVEQHPLQTQYGCAATNQHAYSLTFASDCNAELAEYACSYVQAHNVGWGDQTLVSIDCIKQVFENLDAWTEDRYLYSRGIDHFAPTVLIMLDESGLTLIENREALRAYIGVVNSAERALSAALLHTRLEPITFETLPNDFDVPEAYTYFVPQLVGTHVIETDAGYAVLLYDRWDDCTPWQTQEVWLLVTPDGTVTEQSRRVIYEYDDNSCT